MKILLMCLEIVLEYLFAFVTKRFGMVFLRMLAQFRSCFECTLAIRTIAFVTGCMAIAIGINVFFITHGTLKSQDTRTGNAG